MLAATASPTFLIKSLELYAQTAPVSPVIIATGVFVAWCVAYAFTDRMSNRDDDDVRQWSASIVYHSFSCTFNGQTGEIGALGVQFEAVNLSNISRRIFDLSLRIPLANAPGGKILCPADQILLDGNSRISFDPLPMWLDPNAPLIHHELDLTKSELVFHERRSGLTKSLRIGDQYAANIRRFRRGSPRAGDRPTVSVRAKAWIIDHYRNLVA